MGAVAAQAIKNTQPSLFILQILVYIVVGLLVVGVVLLILTLFLIFIGFLVSKLFNGELGKFKNLQHTLQKFYLYWINWWRKRKHSSWRMFLRRKNHNSENDREKDYGDLVQKKIHFWGQGRQAVIRRGFYRLVAAARTQGLAWHSTDTPQEISSGLTGMLPDQREALSEITTDYQLARYGPFEPTPEKVKLFERLRRLVQLRLKKF